MDKEEIIKHEVDKCAEVMRKSGVILYPTDTIWGIGCDATQPRAVDRVYKIKKRSESKAMIILLDDPERLRNYLKEVPPIIFDLLERIRKPLTVIYPGAVNLPKNVMANDQSVAIRIVKNEFCKKLIQKIDKPLISTSPNIAGEPTPVFYRQISNYIKDSVDYIVKLDQDIIYDIKPSTIIRILNDGEFEVIRE